MGKDYAASTKFWHTLDTNIPREERLARALEALSYASGLIDIKASTKLYNEAAKYVARIDQNG